MFLESYFKQVISFQKATFDNSITAVSLLQDQTASLMQIFLARLPGVPAEGKTMVTHWFDLMREGRETWRQMVDEQFDRMAGSFGPRQEAPEAGVPPREPEPEAPSGEAAGECRLNAASRKEISQLMGIGDATAEKIVTYRDEHGPFQEWDDLQKIPGIKQTSITRLKETCRL